MSQTSEPGATGMEYRRCGRSERRETLAKLLLGRVDPQAETVDHFLDYAQQQGLSLEHVWMARKDGAIQAAGMLVPCSGRTGMIFLSPGLSRQEAAGAAGMIEKMLAGVSPQDVHLVQTLLEPGQALAEEIYGLAGFKLLATLIYLECRGHGSGVVSSAPLDLGEGLTVQTYDSRQREAFGQAILASYEETLDCPLLRGVRDMDDILEGYQAIGRFEPGWWFLVRHGEEAVGVMLLNPLPVQNTLELVYVGLAPRWRGRGIGRKLLEHGLGIAEREGMRALICAVDAVNEPAVKMYERLGFVATGKKKAMIRVLR